MLYNIAPVTPENVDLDGRTYTVLKIENRIKEAVAVRSIRIVARELRGQDMAITLLRQLQACHPSDKLHCELDLEEVHWFCRHALDALITFMDTIILHSGVVVLTGLKSGPGWYALQRRQEHLAMLSETADA